MADKKEYYYLKLKENFFESDDMKFMQGMKDGYLYSDILMKLYLKSLRTEGRLMYRGFIPYTPEMIAQVTGHQVGTVEKAINYFRQIGMIEILDNGAIFMMDIQNFIGKSSDEADRKREYRSRIDAEKSTIIGIEDGQMSGQMSNQMSGQMSGHCPPEIRDRERDKRLETETRDKRLETEKEKEIITVSKDTVRQTDIQQIIDAWNRNPKLDRVSRITRESARGKSLAARIREYGVESVLEAIENISHSEFLQGSSGKWRITFDWFVRPNNFPKVLENQYRDSCGSVSSRVSEVDSWG